MVDADGIPVVRRRVRVRLALAQAQCCVASPEVLDRLAALAFDPPGAPPAERLEQREVEGETALEVGDDEVDVVEPPHSASFPDRARRAGPLGSRAPRGGGRPGARGGLAARAALACGRAFDRTLPVLARGSPAGLRGA